MCRWETEMDNLITTAEAVSPYLNLSPAETGTLAQVLESYPMSITPYYLSLADVSRRDDPILKMCVPNGDELLRSGSLDTSGEGSNTVIDGVQHKYRQTAMVLTTNQCAMYCRHCFRRRLVGLSDGETAVSVDKVMEYITAHPEITNVLLSGGDALMMPNERLAEYLDRLADLPQLDLIRIATRIPVVLPMRIYEDHELLNLFTRIGRRKQLYVVTQFNHPAEVTPEAAKAVRELMERRVVVKNQTVLLGGVNDDGETLGLLLRKLTSIGIAPYYIFQCRPVTGVKNRFQIPLKRGAEIVEQAKNMQNGQGKCVKYCLSHPRGKIEIIGSLPDGRMLFKFHQAKYRQDDSRVFALNLDDSASWLEEDISGGI